MNTNMNKTNNINHSVMGGFLLKNKIVYLQKK